MSTTASVSPCRSDVVELHTHNIRVFVLRVPAHFVYDPTHANIGRVRSHLPEVTLDLHLSSTSLDPDGVHSSGKELAYRTYYDGRSGPQSARVRRSVYGDTNAAHVLEQLLTGYEQTSQVVRPRFSNGQKGGQISSGILLVYFVLVLTRPAFCSFDTKDWERLARAVAPSLYVRAVALNVADSLCLTLTPTD